MLFPTLGPSNLPLWWTSLTKDMQEQFLCWSGMTDTEHTISGSNEEDSKLINKNYSTYEEYKRKFYVSRNFV